MTATTALTRAPIERTEHPHVVKSADVLGGEPRVDGTRIPVHLIFDLAWSGMSPAEIAKRYPGLKIAQVHDALSYAYDHPDELTFHRERRTLRDILKKHGRVYYQNLLLTPAQLAALGPLPPDAKVYDWETLPPEYDR